MKKYYISFTVVIFCSYLFILKIDNSQDVATPLQKKVYIRELYNASQLNELYTVEYKHEPIDAVYTWVNGSERSFMEAVDQYRPKTKQRVRQLANRFADMDQLKYSLRSIELFAPWIRHVYLVTNGQIPNYIDLEFDKITLVTHDEIFPDKDSLPTFSSCAIEVYLHRIKNLSEKYIYFNDDIALMGPTFLSDFWTDVNGTKLFPKKDITPSWWVKYPECSSNCTELFQNSNCDTKCNTFRCEFDGGDCDGITPAKAELSRYDAYHSSTAFTNIVLNRYFNVSRTNRAWYPHLPILFEKSIVEDMQRELSVEFDLTAKHRFRANNDLQIEFTYYNWIIESGKCKYELIDPDIDITYIAYGKFPDRNFRSLKAFRERPKKFLCVNDVMDHNRAIAMSLSIKYLLRFYDEQFPKKSAFEK